LDPKRGGRGARRPQGRGRGMRRPSESNQAVSTQAEALKSGGVWSSEERITCDGGRAPGPLFAPTATTTARLCRSTRPPFDECTAPRGRPLATSRRQRISPGADSGAWSIHFPFPFPLGCRGGGKGGMGNARW
jgi:hypothetical protein